MKLKRKSVAKPWGRQDLPDLFGGQQKQKIGEIWFEPPKGIKPELMIKYLFTSEKLSIQVHPDDRLARRFGLPHGKDECWYIIEAEPDAQLGIGLKKSVSIAKLRAAIACDQIDQLIDWKPASGGDFFYIPAGTIHAIGPGITLVEVQQNIDVTYRIYDFGRARELHLKEALTVAKPEIYDMNYHADVNPDESAILVDGPHFRLLLAFGDETEIISKIKASEWQVIPLEGSVIVDGKNIAAGQCGLCTDASEINLSKNGRSLIACTMR